MSSNWPTNCWVIDTQYGAPVVLAVVWMLV